jgi:monoamine oxidase
MIGKVAGGSAMYQAMSSLGYAAESHYSGPVKLGNARPGASVLVLGAGLAGMVAAHELRAAGYKVQLLEYQSRAGGRCWTLRGGDEFSELDGTRQKVGFAKGNYFNPGPWRVPYHHHAMLDYYKRFGIKLEAFNQVNYNAYLHNSKALAGKPQRFRHVQTDVYGHVAELLSKATNQGALDQSVSREDKERLLESLKAWGVLDKEYRYRASNAVSDFRGYDIDPGGGLMAQAKPSTPMGLHELLESNLWRQMGVGNIYEFHSAIFQPEGGMDMLAQAMARDLGSAIRYNAKVTRIAQNDKGVTVDYVDALKPGATLQARADWCVCTIPLSILSQIEVQAGSAMQNAIAAVPYGSSMKVGLEFKRRFWEEDERIYGGISYTDLPIQQISYPPPAIWATAPPCCWAPMPSRTPTATASPRSSRPSVRLALEYGAQIHPQYKQEFLNGVSVAWHRMPWINGCFGNWTDALREQHYKDLAQIDGRLVLAGEHVSYIPAWQEGAVLSSLDAIQRLHAKASSL